MLSCSLAASASLSKPVVQWFSPLYAEPSSLFACCARLERSFYPRGADPQARPHDRLCPHLHRPPSLCPKLVVDLPSPPTRRRAQTLQSHREYLRLSALYSTTCLPQRTSSKPNSAMVRNQGRRRPPIVSLPITKSTAVRESSARYNLSTDAPPEPLDGAQRAKHQRRTARSSLPPVHS